MPLAQPPFFQNTSVKKAVLFLTLALFILLVIGYGLLFFQLKQIQKDEALRLLNNMVEEINHKIDHQESDFDAIIKNQSSILNSYDIIIFTPMGNSFILSNTSRGEGLRLPSWRLATGNKNSLTYNSSGIEAWYELHNQYQLYANVRPNSWSNWSYNFGHPLYFLPFLASVIILVVFLFLLNRKLTMWRRLINYSEDMQSLITHDYKPLPISPSAFDNETAQIGQALNRLGFQLNKYFHTIHDLNNRQQILVENVPVPLFLLDRKANIIYFNQHFASLFMTAFRPNTLYMLTDFLAGNDKSSHNKLLKLAESKTALSLSVTDIQLSQHFDLHLNPVYNRFGNLQGFSGVLKIVGYYHTQLQQAWLIDKLQQDKLASFDKLWAVLGHELRTPLSGIIGMLDLLNEDKENLNPDQIDILSTLQQSGTTMLQLLNDMLDMAKLGAGKLQLNLTNTDILKLSRQVCALMIGNARRQHIDLLYHATPSVPRHILTDDGRLRQIILNLLSNAIKFTKHGYVALLLETALGSDEIIQKKSPQATATSQWLKITIKDTGIGISQKEQQKLFSFFNQANDSISSQFGGTGLGLAISNNFSQMMGGFIHLQSEVGMGSEFQVYLPIENAELHSAFHYNTTAYHIQLIIFVKYAISVGYIQAIFQHLRVPAIVNLGIDENTIQHINEQLNPDLLPIFLIDELCYVGHEDLFEKITSFDTSPKILGSMESERSLSPTLQEKFDGFLQKPVNMSSFMAEIARLYEKNSVSLQNQDPNHPHTLSQLSVQLQFEHFLQQLDQRKNQPSNIFAPDISKQKLPSPDMPAHNMTFQKTILVAEDNTVNQKIAKKHLEKMGYEVIIAENGLEAISLLQQHRSKIVLVLMDCQMPILDGLETTRRIRHSQDSIPIIALTANDSEEDKAVCLNAGMDGFLTKPLSKEKLTELLSRLMI